MQFNLKDLADRCPLCYATIAVILLTTLYYLYKSRRLPPGPIGLPYFGYWPFLNHETGHLQLEELGRKYGDLLSFTCTGRLYLHMGSLKAVKEIHVNNSDCFAYRMEEFHILSYFFKDGLVCLNGEKWIAIRKFFLMQLRERGMNHIKESFSGPIYDTIRGTVEELKKRNGLSVDIGAVLLTKCTKIMRQTLFGDIGITEEELAEVNKYYAGELMSMSTPNLFLCGTFAKYFIIPFCKGFQEGSKDHELLIKLLYKIVNRRKADFDRNNILDAIDAYFNEKIIRKSSGNPTSEYFTDHALVASLVQIVGDGVFLMSLFIISFIRALLEHPDEQEKIYQELVEVVGEDRDPGIEDKNKLTYTNAFLSEVMRTTDLLPVLISQECTKEFTVRGYRIPKGTVTVYNFWMAHMNPEDYEEPHLFKPSRFIANEGEKKPELLPLFGMGKRSCIGEGFAMIQVFLFLTTIIKQFRLSKPAGEKDTQNLFFSFENLNICANLRKP